MPTMYGLWALVVCCCAGMGVDGLLHRNKSANIPWACGRWIRHQFPWDGRRSIGRSDWLYSEFGFDDKIGSARLVLKWNGSTWMQQPTRTTSNLLGIWGSAPNNVWAVGAGGTILKWDGSAWAAQASGSSSELLGVWGSAPTDVWVVGRAGTILRLNGGVWTTQRTGGRTGYYAVRGSDPSNVWIAGDDGAMVHWDGRRFSDSVAGGGVGASMYGLWVKDAKSAWASVTNGSVLHWDGTSWTAEASGAYSPIAAIAGAGNQLWAVGSYGNIFQKEL